ncbi:MAG: DNA mismatch repair protein MutL, partial [Limisphaerales bacterium]
MSAVIHRLSEALANQIAAGEVVQRPASVVKELMENAVDAGSNHVRVFLKDAGKSLIQVVDDGYGMSALDAVACFDRHATSKISKIEDLFNIHTMGFRGEAMASIASVARVELKTRMAEEEMGTKVIMDASALMMNQDCQTAVGTSVAVKNLFYNVPARRNFLKSNTVEMRRIIEEFQRVALAYPELFFSLDHNGIELFHLKQSNMRQRVVAVLGKQSNEKLVPVEEQTTVLNLTGFAGKPDGARKSRGEQYFFINKRFFKSGYLHHAVTSLYEDLIPEKHHPLYVLFLDIDPERIDINVHPTKQEVKFEDEKIIYTFIQAAVRHALARFSAMPSLDFSLDTGIANLAAFSRPATASGTQHLLEGKTFKFQGSSYNQDAAQMKKSSSGDQPWEALFEVSKSKKEEPPQTLTIASDLEEGLDDSDVIEPVQLHRRYIMSPIKSGFLLLDQQAAHERILFEHYLKSLAAGPIPSQRQLFPSTIELSPSDANILMEILEDIRALGFDVQPFGDNAFVVHGLPPDCGDIDGKTAIDEFLEAYRG